MYKLLMWMFWIGVAFQLLGLVLAVSAIMSILIRPTILYLIACTFVAVGLALIMCDYFREHYWAPPIHGSFGYFEGQISVKWLNEDREMQLLEDFVFVDQFGERWAAPKGSITNGASIPQVAWSVVGAPFTGQYRKAAVVHDVACKRRDRPWQEVHRAFFSACMCAGVEYDLSRLLFGAVYRAGPKWNSAGKLLYQALPRQTQEEYLEKLRHFIRTSNPSLREIEEFNPNAP